MKKLRLSLLTLTALLLGFAPSASASEYGYNYDTYGGFAFANDSIPIENIAGSEDTTGVNRWEATGNINLIWKDYEPSNGIYFRGSSTLTAEKGWAAYASPKWEWVYRNGTWGWRTTSCKIVYQTGLPSLKKQMVLTHEVAHCLGHMNHRDSSTSILRTGTSGWSTYYRPTSTDLSHLRDIYNHNG